MLEQQVTQDRVARELRLPVQQFIATEWAGSAVLLAAAIAALVLANSPAGHAFDALWEAYARHVAWETLAGLDARTAALLPGLLLGRIDGKSPVEYLTTEPDRDRVRRFAAERVRAAPPRLSAIAADWKRAR